VQAGLETTATSARRDRVRRWLLEACFPFWAERGEDPRGGFRERLALDGAPIEDAMSRVRVQARQTYLFAAAADMGWSPQTARRLAARGVETMLGPCRRPDFLFGKLVAPGESLVDPQPELYDNAFCLLGLAAAARALGEPRLLAEADRTLAALDAALAHPEGGFHETHPPRLPRRQNPHMHLFEALLALEEAGPGRGYIGRADAVFALFKAHFFDPASDVVVERFDAAWAPRRDEPVEPGHMFEWVWLLVRYAALKRMPTPDAARRLYQTACGFLNADGFAPQSASRGRGAVDGTRRTWPQTETLKAHLVMGEMARADALLDAIFDAYLAEIPPGAWRDHFDANGRMIATDIQASTGYHVVLSFIEYMKNRQSAP
jgi:mannose-6-phosphate isomerase